MSNISNFQEKVVAKMQEGSSSDATALAIAKKADSAIKLQIASLESELVDEEAKVEDATEALNNAKYVTEKIEDPRRYVKRIVDAQASLDEAQATLDNTKASMAYFVGLQTELFGKEKAEKTTKAAATKEK